MRYRFSHAMHGALVRRLTCSVEQAVNDSGSFNLSTSCQQLSPVTPALFSNTQPTCISFQLSLKVIVYVCLLTVRN